MVWVIRTIPKDNLPIYYYDGVVFQRFFPELYCTEEQATAVMMSLIWKRKIINIEVFNKPSTWQP